jgi:hypothetical protein
MRHLVVILSSLLASLAPGAFAAPPALGPLQFLPGDAALAGASGEQAAPDLARGGDGFLAVWSDARAQEGKYDVYGIRLDAAGDPVGASFAINQDDGSQVRPLVAWNGQNWLVAFMSNATLSAVRVAPDGSLLDAQPIAIASPGSDAAYLLASDGAGWAVLWAGRTAGSADLRGARIGASGTVLDPGGVQILPETYFVRPIDSIAFCKDRYLVVWGADAGIVGLRLSPTLQKLDPSPITIAGGAYFESAPEIAGNGTEFYLVWTESDNSYWVNQIKGSRVSLAGVAATPAGVPVNENLSGGSGADVAWDGTRWVAAWTGAGAFANRISAAGSVLDGTGFQLASGTVLYDARDIAAAGAPGGGAKAVWTDYRNHLENDIWGAMAGASGTAGPNAIVGLSAPSQQSPRVVWNGNGYTVAYLSLTSGGGRVLVQRLDAGGAAIDQHPVEVAAGPDVVEPWIAWSGTRYLVVWKTRSDVRVHARRLAPDLSLQDVAPIEVMAGDGPSVAALGDVFLVAAQNSPSYWQWRDTYAQRIDGATGAKLGGLIGLAGGFAWAGTVGTVGNRWLLSWEAHYSHNESPYTLVAAWVNADGTAGPNFGLVSGSGFGTAGVEIASHPQLGAIVYSTTRAPSASNGEIYLIRVQADGALPDGYTGLLVTGNASGNQYAPGAAWNGVEFVAAFQDDRASTPFVDYPESDIYASRVTSAAVVLDGVGGFPVETAPVPEWQPAVAGSGGDTLVAASHLRGGEFGSLRVGVRRLIPADAPLPAVDGLRFQGGMSIVWNGGKAGTVYDMLRGDLRALATVGSIADAACLADDLPSTSHDDTSRPGAGTGFYYLVRADRSGSVPGTYDDPVTTGLAHGRDDDVGGSGCPHIP